MTLRTGVTAAQNSTLPFTGKIYSIIKQLFNIVIISHNITVYNCIFDQINAALVSIKNIIQKHYKTATPNVLLVYMSHFGESSKRDQYLQC